jgi:uncharacterized protein YndB with AHSA1/START domain
MPERTRPPLMFRARVAASPGRVFDAFFREPQRWLCRQARVEPRVGGTIRLCWPDGCVEGRFAQCEPDSVARFTWRMQGDSLPETMVVVRFSSADGAQSETDLELEHYGFGVGEDWDMAYVGAARAWAAYFKNLRAVLEANLDLREPFE